MNGFIRDFSQNLINAGATEDIYLDIFPYLTKHATNWITFYK